MARYLITASLLDAWKYLLNNEYSKMEDFMQTLRREQHETTPAQEAGFKFEKWAEQNYHETLNGSYQVKVYKDFHSSTGTDYLLYGIIDCIKSGKIYDYKHTNKYDVGKFYNKAQTSMYLELVPEASSMTYVISTDTPNYIQSNDPYIIYTEVYTRDETPKIKDIIADFELWLKNMNLFEIYKTYWEAK